MSLRQYIRFVDNDYDFPDYGIIRIYLYSREASNKFSGVQIAKINSDQQEEDKPSHASKDKSVTKVPKKAVKTNDDEHDKPSHESGDSGNDRGSED